MKLFRAILILVLFAALGVVAAEWLNDPALRRFGQVVVQAGGHDYVATLPKAGLLLVIAVLLLWLLWTLLAAPFRVWVRYRRRQARTRLIDGLTALHHGRWQAGEKLLLTAADDPEAGPVALSAALRAADKRHDESAALRHLQRLQELDPLRHALLQARRLLGREQPAEALALLDTPALQPLPPRGQVLRQRALVALQRADEAYGLLGALRSQNALAGTQLAALETGLAEQMLLQSAEVNALAGHWEALPKASRHDPLLVAAYAQRAAQLGWQEPAARALEQALEAQWSPQLLPQLAEIGFSGDAEQQRERLQRWLDSHPDEPALLLAAAQLARRQDQWPRAQDLLHRALAMGAGAPAWEALGEGHAAAGEDGLAATCLLNALRVRRGLPVQPVDNRDLRQQITDVAMAEQRDAHGLPHLADLQPPLNDGL